MVNLLIVELYKLKRSYMLPISLAGATVAPFINLLVFIAIQRIEMEVEVVVSFASYADQINMFAILVIGTLLYGLMTTYSFSREYQEDTLKSILIVPVNRTMLIVSKALLIFIWIQMLSLYTLLIGVVFSLMGGFGPDSLGVFLEALKTYVLTGALMFMLVMPVLLLTAIFKSYVASIAFTIGLIIVNLVLINSEYLAVYPWLAPLNIVNPLLVIDRFPVWYSWAAILATGIISLLATIVYFNRQDI